MVPVIFFDIFISRSIKRDDRGSTETCIKLDCLNVFDRNVIAFLPLFLIFYFFPSISKLENRYERSEFILTRKKNNQTLLSIEAHTLIVLARSRDGSVSTSVPSNLHLPVIIPGEQTKKIYIKKK